jgi:hypothetical protein
VKPLRDWSLTRVLFMSAVWFVLSLAAWVYFTVRDNFVIGEGGGGIGAVSITVNPLVLAIPIVPPFLLILAWLIPRLRKP